MTATSRIWKARSGSPARLCAVVGAAGLVLSLVLATATAEAECYAVPDCDKSSSCKVCTDPTPPDHQWYTDGTKLFPGFRESPGGQIGQRVAKEVVQIFLTQGLPSDTPPIDAGAVDLESYLQKFEEGSKAAVLDDARSKAYDAGTAQLPGKKPVDWELFMPVDQGPPRLPFPTGRPNDTASARNLSDPVNPANGEFYIEQVDLAFPGFGVPYRHVRTYRSRVSFDNSHGFGWDHLLNQRITQAPAPLNVPPGPDVTTGTIGGDSTGGGAPPLGSTPDTLAPDAYCGPELVFSTGQATTLRFREISRTSDTVEYASGGLALVLQGHISDGELTWSLVEPSGMSRRFDAEGRLVRWEDANGVGLAISWEAGTDRLDWRIAQVADSVGRLVHYVYDASDRLVEVRESTSGLAAVYAYDARGDLVQATSASGRTEHYEYDYQAGRTAGAWVPEWILEDSCQLACASSASSCEAGGACDPVFEGAMESCLGSCGDCASSCKAQCPSTCDQACRVGDADTQGCTSYCDEQCKANALDGEIEAICAKQWKEVGAPACGECASMCNQDQFCAFAAECIREARTEKEIDGDIEFYLEGSGDCLSKKGALVVADAFVDAIKVLVYGAAELVDCLMDLVACSWNPWCDVTCFEMTAEKLEEFCNQTYDTCCRDGVECGDLSCGSGKGCEAECAASFWGEAIGNDCVSTADMHPWVLLPMYGSPEYEAIVDVFGTVDEWADKEGCWPKLKSSCGSFCTTGCVAGCAEQCKPRCAQECGAACHLDDCAGYCNSLELMAVCETGCTQGCVDASHQAGPVVGPKYGHPRDLNHNLVRIYDGNGNLYLENVYGQNLGSPDFDAVIAQDFGDHPSGFYYRDLAGEARNT